VGPDKFPKGKLTAVLSFQALSREHKTYQIQWSPDSDQAGPYATATPQPGVCLSRTNFAQLQAFPTGMTGKVLLNERQDNDLPSNLILVNLDGSQPQALLRQGYGGVLSPDGKQLAYATVNGITLLDIATGQSVLLKGTPQAYGPWSPDGKQIAYVGEGGATTDGIFVVPTDGSSAPRRLTNLGYEAIAGWSPDGQRLYYAIPGLILKEVDMSTGVSRDLFALKDSSAKDPSPTLSPDGVWIAYAGTDGLYVVRTDGTQGHLLIDDRSLEDGISGLSGYAWGQSSDWLVVNLVGSDETDNKVILLNPDTCEAYLLPNLNGEVKGLILP
jgi:Tol biopolymer transport system component